MELESIQVKIRTLDNEISDVNRQIGKLNDELEESYAALQSAKKVQREFEEFVSRRKRAKDSNPFGNALKSFESFLSKASSILTGDDYWKAKDRVDELNRVASRKIQVQSEDLEYCKKELRRLKRQREELMVEYNSLLAATSEGGAVT